MGMQMGLALSRFLMHFLVIKITWDPKVIALMLLMAFLMAHTLFLIKEKG